jgi:hypothetical protein
MKQYLLVNCQPEHSTHNGVPLWRITWLDEVTGELLETTTDSSYRNHYKWQSIITNPQPTGYYTGLRRTARKTREGVRVMSADSSPRLIAPISHDQVQDTLHDILYPPKNEFNRLFQTQ